MVRLIQMGFIFFCFIMVLPTAEAQILNRLKRKAERAAEKAAEEEFDKAMSKKVDEELNQDSTERRNDEFGGYDRTEEALSEAITGQMMGKYDVSDVELPDNYTFELSISYEIQTEDEDPVEMTFLLAPQDEKYMGFTGRGDSKQDFQQMVWDLERNVFVMYQDNEEGKTLIKLPNFTQLADKQMEEELAKQSEMTITKTGETKNILGYHCEKYIMEDDKNYGEAWMAHDFPYSYERFSALMSTHMKTPGYSKLSMEDGYALEMLTREKKKKAKTTVMKVVDIDASDFRIVNGDYSEK